MTQLHNISGAGDKDSDGKGQFEIELASGRYLDMRNPDYTLITLSDIAHHLAQCNRYAGACKRPFSVAEHAVLVSNRLESLGASWEICLYGLHHDDGEAFTHDITRPTKDLIRPLYDPVEERVWLACIAAMELPPIGNAGAAMIKLADNWALSKEAWHLMHSQGVGWWSEGLYDAGDTSQNTPELAIPQREQSFFDIKARYKARHRHIMRRIG